MHAPVDLTSPAAGPTAHRLYLNDRGGCPELVLVDPTTARVVNTMMVTHAEIAALVTALEYRYR